MLREIGVRVWQPAAPLPEPLTAIDLVAASAHVAGAAGIIAESARVAKAAETRPAAAPARTPAPPAQTPQAAAPGNGPAGWSLGEAQTLYADTATPQGARWLVLVESAAAVLPDQPFQGDAGKLLGNMLRAARLQLAGAVLLAPLARHAAAGSAGADFSAALAALLQRAQPDVVLVMGRLAAQALLQSSEPFGKLRGQVHQLQGAKTIVTYDAPYLLRSPADKAKAWDDLCLAISLTRTA